MKVRINKRNITKHMTDKERLDYEKAFEKTNYYKLKQQHGKS